MAVALAGRCRGIYRVGKKDQEALGGWRVAFPPSTGRGSVREKGRQAGFGGMSKSMPSFSVKGRGRVSGKGLYGTVFLYGYEGGDLSFVFWVG